MWETSTSTQELETSTLSFSRNKAMGMEVEKSLFETASAVVLSDNVGMRIGMREPGKN